MLCTTSINILYGSLPISGKTWSQFLSYSKPAIYRLFETYIYIIIYISNINRWVLMSHEKMMTLFKHDISSLRNVLQKRDETVTSNHSRLSLAGKRHHYQ